MTLTFLQCTFVASVPGLLRSVRVLIMRRRQTFEKLQLEGDSRVDRDATAVLPVQRQWALQGLCVCPKRQNVHELYSESKRKM